ncbi:putative mitochondrial carrier domain-containing protein [Rosa chinensis]|uniref:Putative mitochondrial carrier domain-containing protein n=1 Tax=Rosa chinensis TaxID=74649 RepID=A0A2P6PWG6_ROSCH|nr:mitochondrial substrate carrier family protein ucpB [Rosa chinensis]PRQ26246.1 putative mitochondrial carrier domain-containing protein [Rosa chinensis]
MRRFGIRIFLFGQRGRRKVKRAPKFEGEKLGSSNLRPENLGFGSGRMKADEKPSWGLVSPSGVAYHFGTSGLSVAVATAVTHPLDVLKVRLQMQLVGQKGPLTGMGRLFLQVLKNEGPRFLYLGLTPALTRSVLYGGLRLGLYEPSKYACNWAFGSNNVFVKIGSAGFGGAIATALTNPVEVLKVRLQMNPNLRKGAAGEVRAIIGEEGVKALWKGVGPAMTRAATLTASQLATYDETKRMLIRCTPLEEGFHLHLTSSTVAGMVSTLLTAPVDMIKTRLMLQQESERVGSYRNGFHCAYQVLRTEGPRGLYKGSLAMFARLGPQTTITFIVCEKLRELAGLKAI